MRTSETSKAMPTASAQAKSEPVMEAGGSELSSGQSANSGSFLDQIKRKLEQKRRRLLIAAIEAASRAQVDSDEFVLEFAPESKHYRDTLARSDNAKIMREACAEVCGKEIGIRFVITDGADANHPVSKEEEEKRTQLKARQAAAQDPAVQQVLRAFGAEIVDVKLR